MRNRKQFVNIELEWANKGVKARVKRNEKRLKRAKELKLQLEKDEASYREKLTTIKGSYFTEKAQVAEAVKEEPLEGVSTEYAPVMQAYLNAIGNAVK